MKKTITLLLVIALTVSMFTTLSLPVKATTTSYNLFDQTYNSNYPPYYNITGNFDNLSTDEQEATYQARAQGWTTFQGSTVCVSSERAHSGDFSLKMSYRPYAWSSPTINIYNMLKQSGAGTYYIRFWVYVEDTNTTTQHGRLIIRGGSTADINSFISGHLDSSGSYGVITENVITPSNMWINYTAYLEVKQEDIERSSGIFNLMIDQIGAQSGQELYMDDFQIYKLPTDGILNGNFEFGDYSSVSFTEWYGGQLNIVDTENHTTGLNSTYSAHYIRTGDYSSIAYNVSPILKTNGAGDYSVSFYIKLDNSTNPSVTSEVYDVYLTADNCYYHKLLGSVQVDIYGWAHFSLSNLAITNADITDNLTPSLRHVQLRLQGPAGSMHSSYFIDDIEFEPCDPPLVISPSVKILDVGQQFNLLLQTGVTASWYSSDTSVATVSNGTVTAVMPGQTTITATSGGKSATCIVYVKSFSILANNDIKFHDSNQVFWYLEQDASENEMRQNLINHGFVGDFDTIDLTYVYYEKINEHNRELDLTQSQYAFLYTYNMYGTREMFYQKDLYNIGNSRDMENKIFRQVYGRAPRYYDWIENEWVEDSTSNNPDFSEAYAIISMQSVPPSLTACITFGILSVATVFGAAEVATILEGVAEFGWYDAIYLYTSGMLPSALEALSSSTPEEIQIMKEWTTELNLIMETASEKEIDAIQQLMPQIVNELPASTEAIKESLQAEVELMETVNWPADNGFVPGTKYTLTLETGDLIDRYGSSEAPNCGYFTSPVGTSFSARALPFPEASYTYQVYRVIQPFDVTAGNVLPWFGQAGYGIQYQMYYYTIQQLIDLGYLEEVPIP